MFFELLARSLPINWEADRAKPRPMRRFGKCPCCGRVVGRTRPLEKEPVPLPGDTRDSYAIELGPMFEPDDEWTWWPCRPRQESRPGRPRYGHRGHDYHAKDGRALSDPWGARGSPWTRAVTVAPAPAGSRRRYNPPTRLADPGDLLVCLCGAVIRIERPSLDA
jgi:hypothetical protein